MHIIQPFSRYEDHWLIFEQDPVGRVEMPTENRKPDLSIHPNLKNNEYDDDYRTRVVYIFR